MKLSPNDTGENGVSNVCPSGCRRLANDSEKLLYAGLLAMALCSYGGFVKRHERVNAFNLVIYKFTTRQHQGIVAYSHCLHFCEFSNRTQNT